MNDPYYPFVTRLLHFDGANGGTVFTDQKGGTMTPTGTPTTSTAKQKFGTASLLLDGSSYLSMPTLAFNAQPFTIEGWFNPTSAPANMNFLGQDNGGGSTPKLLMYLNGSGNFVIDFGSLGTTITSTTAPILNAWSLLSISKNANNVVSLGVNGVSVASGSVGTLAGITAAFNIGYIGEAFGSKFIGNVDDFRVTIGVGRNFNVPTSAFPNS